MVGYGPGMHCLPRQHMPFNSIEGSNSLPMAMVWRATSVRPCRRRPVPAAIDTMVTSKATKWCRKLILKATLDSASTYVSVERIESEKGVSVYEEPPGSRPGRAETSA